MNAGDAMHSVDELAKALEGLAREIGGDFAALAKLARFERRAKWVSVFGASSARVARMELKAGLGVGGMAIQLGVPFQASGEKNAYMLGECPVMLAERLTAAIAVPLPASANDSGSGVLLVGRRGAPPFNDLEIRQISSRMPIWIELMTLWRYDGGKWNVTENGGTG